MKVRDHKRYAVYDLIRLIALIDILLLHALQSVGKYRGGVPWIWGVPIFLILSGHLFGKKQIDDVRAFYVHRIFKIMVPYLAVLGINWLIYAFLNGKFSWGDLIRGCLLLPSFPQNKYGMVHTWYITYIIACYLETPLLQWVSHSFIEKGTGWFLAGYSAVYFINCIVYECIGLIPFVGNTSSVWVNVYSGAYLISRYCSVQNPLKFFNKECDGEGIWYIVIGFAALTFFSIVRWQDKYPALCNIAELYMQGVSAYIVFGVLIYVFRGITSLPPLASMICSDSYYTYLVHYWFTSMSWFGVFGVLPNVIAFCVYIILTACATAIFKSMVAAPMKRAIKISRGLLMLKKGNDWK